ncbi:MAG TPA: hypothetical protein PLX97_14245, partial [Gemmatales bacterium]|nr:hypothetical protein [Gemmatales bacterium]
GLKGMQSASWECATGQPAIWTLVERLDTTNCRNTIWEGPQLPLLCGHRHNPPDDTQDSAYH